MKLGERIRSSLAVAGLNPRHLGGATRIHFVTIYRIMNNADGNMFPSNEHTLTEALRKIDSMVKQGKLPMTGKLSRKEKTDRLKAMLADHN